MLEPLFQCRLAHRALVMVLEQFNLAGEAVHFNPDDPSQVFSGLHENEIAFFEYFSDGIGEALAIVVLVDTEARVVIEDIRRLIRRNRQAEFRPEDVGIAHQRGEADIDVVVDLAELVETDGETMRKAPRRKIGPRPRPFEHGAPELGFKVVR
jgi:hypothetical protein